MAIISYNSYALLRFSMSKIRPTTSFFASSPELQIPAMRTLPYDRGAKDFYLNLRFNPLLVLTRGFLDDSSHHDYEPWEEFIARTGLPDDFSFNDSALEELRCVLYGLKTRIDETCWTKRGLTEKTGWKVVRRLSRAMLEELGWAEAFEGADIQIMIDEYT